MVWLGATSGRDRHEGGDHRRRPRWAGGDRRRRRIGRAAEELAVRFLTRRGARLIAKNLELADGEIDLLVVIDGERAVVEVRSVTGDASPLDAFDHRKEEKVRRLAASLRPPVTRIDLVAIRFDEEGAHIHWIPKVG